MRTRAGLTAAVAVLSLLAGVGGHGYVDGHPVDVSAIPQLALLAAFGALLGWQRVGPAAQLAGLAAIQLGVHVALMGEQPAAPPAAVHMHHHHHHGSMPVATDTAGAGTGFPMMLVHLAGTLGAVVVLHRAGRWWLRLRTLVARILPVLPSAAPSPLVARPAAGAAAAAVPCPERWLPGGVLRRGPPPV
jgi:hypothetical protein